MFDPTDERVTPSSSTQSGTDETGFEGTWGDGVRGDTGAEDPAHAPSERLVLPADVDSWPVGPVLGLFLDWVDPSLLSEADRARYVALCERQVGAAQGRSLVAVGAVAAAYRELEPEDDAAAFDGAAFELRCAVRWTRRRADAEMDLATDLMVRLPMVLEALRSGRIDRPRAKTISDGVRHLDVAHARDVAVAVLDDAPLLTTGELGGRVRRKAVAVDPDGHRRRTARAKAERRFMSWEEPDGTLSLLLSGIDPVVGRTVCDRVNRIARELRGSGETRTMDQLRADVAADLLAGAHSSQVGSVHLTVDLATLAGMVSEPGDLAGYGPIAADIARQLVAETGRSVFEWTATHPSSFMPVADGTTRNRRHSASQARKLRGRFGRCVAPGCRMPVVDCDLDHTTPWSESGVTSTEESAPLCRHDHCIRHRTGWSYSVSTDGDVTWLSPFGGTYKAGGRDP